MTNAVISSNRTFTHCILIVHSAPIESFSAVGIFPVRYSINGFYVTLWKEKKSFRLQKVNTVLGTRVEHSFGPDA